jgi:hypothetical protein
LARVETHVGFAGGTIRIRKPHRGCPLAAWFAHFVDIGAFVDHE